MNKPLAFGPEFDATFDDVPFKESEHPRGQPGNAGQFGPGGGSKSKIKGTGNGAKPQPNFRGSLARETSGDTTQPVKSLDELYERAKKAEPDFKKTVEETASKQGCTVQYTPEEYAEPGTILKSRKSAARKLNDELSGDPKLLRDVIRATVVGDTTEKARKAAADFIGEHGDNILRVKDRYVDQVKGGYRDILINYRTPDGLVAEVQFNSKNMVETKNKTAHHLYEKAREMVNPTPEALEQLEQQMSVLYEKAYLADGDGKWKQKKMSQAKDAESVGPLRCYQLSKEDGPSFQAVIVKKDDTLEVLTNRGGDWAPEPELSFADLVMPEQSLSDWNVTPIQPEQLKDFGEAGETDDFAEAGGPPRDAKHRAVDRTFDIEYYTAETLGPRRERTPEGFLICYDVPAARVGEMIYGPGEVPFELGLGRDGRVRVQRTEGEVFSPKSMSSLNGKPVTDDHPPVDVDPKNWKFYTKGTVNNPRRGEGEQSDFLIVDLFIFDEDTIKDIEAGKREVSCGYNPDYMQLLDDADQPIPGRGEQINILYNHLALVKAGRCGPACAIGDRKTVDTDGTVNTFFSEERAQRLQRLADSFD
jgi:hypothetical protein